MEREGHVADARGPADHAAVPARTGRRDPLHGAEAGRKCPFKSKKLKLGKTRRAAKNALGSLKAKQRKFRAGQTVEVQVSAPGFNTKVSRWVLKKGKVPPTQPFCVIPGERTTRKTCT